MTEPRHFSVLDFLVFVGVVILAAILRIGYLELCTDTQHPQGFLFVQDLPPANVREKASVPQQLVLARAALINRNQYAARGLMEEAQTSIVFEPANTGVHLSTVAVSQLTEALVMLSNGNEAGALQCLNQAIAAIRPMS